MNSPEFYLAALFNSCFPTLNWQSCFPFHLFNQIFGTLGVRDRVTQAKTGQFVRNEHLNIPVSDHIKGYLNCRFEERCYDGSVLISVTRVKNLHFILKCVKIPLFSVVYSTLPSTISFKQKLRRKKERERKVKNRCLNRMMENSQTEYISISCSFLYNLCLRHHFPTYCREERERV